MKKAVIVSLTMLFLCVSVTGLWANNLFLPLLTNEFTGELTGRWEGSLTSGSTTGCNLGTAGLLLRQSGDLVTGTIVGFQISYGNFVNGVFTGTALLSDQSLDLSYTLSADKQTLNGRIIKQEPGKADQTLPFTFIRLSNDPTNPGLTPPAVEQITLSKSPPYVISVRWSKPIVGWNIQLKTYIGGIFSTISGTNLVDCTPGNYNPQTFTYTMQIKSTVVPDPGAASTLSLCPDIVAWADAYGIPAWPNCSQTSPINFNWPNL